MKVNRNGVTISGTVFWVFLIQKLTGVIAWSWWWVTAPLWGVTILGGALLALSFAGAALADRGRGRY